MRLLGAAAVLGACVAALATAGCRPQCPSSFVSRQELLREYNANAAAVPRLWARAKLAVTLVDKNGRTFTWGSASPLASPNGLLLYFRGPGRLGPHDFVLIGREIAGVDLFRLGSSTEQGVYYFWFRLGERGGAWWGRQEFAGAPASGVLPIDPNQLLAVLGVTEMPDDLTRLPAVAMTMSADPCAYVLTYVDRQAVTGEIGFRREMYFRWEDGAPRRAFLVNFFAPDGRRVMTARLNDYKPIASEAAARGPAPVMPTDIEIETVEWRGRERNPVRRIHLVLSDMTTAEKAQRGACKFAPPKGAEVTQVDAGIEMRGSK